MKPHFTNTDNPVDFPKMDTKMNERIRELAQQADIHFGPDRVPETGFEYEGAEVTVEDLIKFAELIVRECANIVNSLEQYEGQGDCSTAEYIKERFGVE